MNLWIIIFIVLAAAVFGIDYLLRRKKWSDNTKAEKISLIVNMLSAGFNAFLSVLGMLWGITGSGAETLFGEILYTITITLGGVYFIVAIAVLIMSLVFRKTGKVKASIWVNVIALLYIIVVLTINYLAGTLL